MAGVGGFQPHQRLCGAVHQAAGQIQAILAFALRGGGDAVQVLGRQPGEDGVWVFTAVASEQVEDGGESGVVDAMCRGRILRRCFVFYSFSPTHPGRWSAEQRSNESRVASTTKFVTVRHMIQAF